ncbi:hypothetical protein XENTR_v10014551 [Xenopus tropicalis]|nr:hypothetical protein XENTR_v10014551 [Xenopus tropicalis]
MAHSRTSVLLGLCKSYSSGPDDPSHGTCNISLEVSYAAGVLYTVQTGPEPHQEQGSLAVCGLSCHTGSTLEVSSSQLGFWLSQTVEL